MHSNCWGNSTGTKGKIIITAGTKTEVSGRKLFRNLRILQLAQ
jgi:hypothetical protein